MAIRQSRRCVERNIANQRRKLVCGLKFADDLLRLRLGSVRCCERVPVDRGIIRRIDHNRLYEPAVTDGGHLQFATLAYALAFNQSAEYVLIKIERGEAQEARMFILGGAQDFEGISQPLLNMPLRVARVP